MEERWQDGEQRQTEPISAARVRVYQQGLSQSSRRQPALLLIHQDGMLVEPLDPTEPLVVGGAAPADVCIEDATLSREHARVSLADGGVLIEDLDSLNGVWASGKRVPHVLLRPGQEAMLGGVLVTLRGAGDEPAETTLDTLDNDDLIAGTAMHALLDMARKVARSRASVVLLGETGSGKELLARYLHTHSPRAAAALVSVNCGAIPGTLIESTLFGHERGAFTGAHKQQKGVFESADGGSVFLDEVGELPLAAQAALLRVLECGRFCRVGSVEERSTDVRVIAATHCDLLGMSQDGSFRADLYYRLSTITLTVPPLRDRRDDIGPLALRLLQRANAANGRSVTGFSDAALGRLAAYRWPGNVRELRNVVERGVIICDGGIIDAKDLPPSLGRQSPSVTPPPAGKGKGAPADGHTHPRGLRDRLHEYEARLISEALENCHFNRRKAAELLGIPVRTLAHKIKLLDLDASDG